MKSLFAALLTATSILPAQPVSPDRYFGHRLGADRQIARWDKIVEYFQVIEKEGAGKLKVVNLGPTTQGNPFLLVIVSSPQNIASLDRYQRINARLSDPRGVMDDEARKLASEGKAVVCQTMSLHASEIGGTQMAPELAWDLITRTDDEARRILDNVILFLIPSFNPDGQIMVTDWYRKYVGTQYEGADLPWLYHKYAGHDNNRDAFQTNLVESQYLARLMFRDWVPQAYVDHHHMGSYGARIYVPPYAEPVRPHADPLVWREMSWYGAHIAYKEEEASLSGVLNMAMYSGWGHFGFHWITPFHNIAGMLTESASAKLATPLFIHPDQLEGGTRGLPQYAPQTTFPNPWPGGWWRLRDVVDRQKTSAWAILDLAARNRETVLWNAYLKASRQIKRGAEGKPAAYVIPAAQHDPLTAVKLVNKLLAQGVEIRQHAKGFQTAAGVAYGPGSWVVPAAQPKSGLIRYLLGRTFYPDNEWTRARDGSPMRPYDMAADTMFEFMGVRVDPVDFAPGSGLAALTAPVEPPGGVAPRGPAGWVLDARLNDSFRAVNLLFDKGVAVRRVDKTGDFVVASAPESLAAEVSKQTGVRFASASGQASRETRRLRLGMYQRYRGGNMDEGWTRLLLEQFGFPYATLFDAEIKKGALNQKYDAIILADDSTAMITGERPPAGAAGGRGGAGFSRSDDSIPPEYRSGIGNEGVAALKTFVEKGGVLITLARAGEFPIEKLGLRLRNSIANRNSREFWCPGSTLRMEFDNTHPLAWGMPAQGLGVYTSGNPVFDLLPGDHNEHYEVVARYSDRDVLESGWLIGQEMIARKAAVVSAKLGEGRVVLIGFRAQHRAQTHGTYKLLFNALLK